MKNKHQSTVGLPHRRRADRDPFELREVERELSSFHQAVLRMYGHEEARKAAESWIEVLETAACLERPVSWRHISVKAAAKLASRLVAPPMHNSTDDCTSRP